MVSFGCLFPFELWFSLLLAWWVIFTCNLGILFIVLGDSGTCLNLLFWQAVTALRFNRWFLAYFYELWFQWQFNFCCLGSVILVCLVYQVLLVLPLVPWWCCLREKKRFPQARLPGVFLGESCGATLLLLTPSPGLSGLGRKEKSLGPAGTERPSDPAACLDRSLPHPPITAGWEKIVSRPVGTKSLPGSNPCNSWVPLAGLACPAHLSISPGKRGISDTVRKESVSPGCLYLMGLPNDLPSQRCQTPLML